MTRKYFGTDGIRAKVGEFPLTEKFIENLAFASANVLANTCAVKKVVIGNDTRESAFWIFEALCKGFNRAGFGVDYAGTVSTPCLSILAHKKAYSFGVMISASHNPYHDNGIKFFLNSGEKLSDETELEIEKILEIEQSSKSSESSKNLENKNCLYEDISADVYEFYKNFLVSTLAENFSLVGFTVALDCANGSLSAIAPQVFEALGAKVLVFANTPDGKNINTNCGSTHIESLVKFVKDNEVDIGFAFDGDGDRIIAVRNDGKILDGDFLMGILTKFLKDDGKLKNNALALTVMSNLGLKIFLKDEKINFFETKVGDRYIYESLIQNDLVIGGEQSGHIILKKYWNTGDGLLVALHVLKVMFGFGRDRFFELTEKIKILPQVLVNIRLKERKNIFENTDVNIEYGRIEQILGNKGRILVRYSGTEPLLRIMLEGQSKDEIKLLADKFAEVVLKWF
jgi:phosphoglucosamine mutase